MSSPQHPVLGLPDPGSSLPPVESLPPKSTVDENPTWGVGEVIALFVALIAVLILAVLILTYLAQRFVYTSESFMEVVQHHLLVVVGAQMLAYIVLLVIMVMVVRSGGGPQSFWQAIRWNWPRNWWIYLWGGIGLQIFIQLLGHVLPMPKGQLPIDRFFQTPANTWVLAVFGMTLGPLMEELYFRGFLYPVLARWLGVAASVLITGFGFGMIHASQLGQAWAPVLLVFLVGVVLTLVRARTKSVAAGLLVHISYNATLFAAMFAATGGFRHLEKFNQ